MCYVCLMKFCISVPYIVAMCLRCVVTVCIILCCVKPCYMVCDMYGVSVLRKVCICLVARCMSDVVCCVMYDMCSVYCVEYDGSWCAHCS